MSTKTNHTPGPWTYNILPLKSYHKVPEISIYNLDGHEFIRQSYDTYSDQAMLSEGDACLIAAAPDMLEALERMMANAIYDIELDKYTIEMSGFVASINKSIIAKAKGEQV